MSLLSRSSAYFEMYPGLWCLGYQGGDSLFSAVCKESRVQEPGASGFYYRAGDFCSLLVRRASAVVFFFCRGVGGGNSNYRRIVINPVDQKGFWG